MRFVGVYVVIFALVLSSANRVLASSSYSGSEDRLGFDTLVDAPAPDVAQITEIASWLQDRLLTGISRDVPQFDDPWPRVVFLTLSDGRASGVVFHASGNGLTEAAERVLARALLAPNPRAWTLLKIDVVDRVGKPQVVGVHGRLELEYGLEGLAFENNRGLAFLPEVVAARKLVTRKHKIRIANVEAYVSSLNLPEDAQIDRLWKDGAMTVRAFTTRSFFADSVEIFPLYRGHRVLRHEQADELLAAAIQAGDYLRRAVKEDGSFVYSYLPKTDQEADKYNMLRHAGTTYSMFELYQETRDPDLLEAAERALEFLRRQVVVCEAGNPEALCVEAYGHVKLGGNALAILAFAKHAEVTGDRSALPMMAGLAHWMTGNQAPSGEFLVHKLEFKTGVIEDMISEYYPGEALFALTRLYELDGNPTWIDAARRGARWLITVRDGDFSDSELSHDHWLLYALNELNRKGSDPIFAEHGLRLARVITSSQNRSPKFPDWHGSYYKPPRSTPTATRSEGLIAAYAIARREGKDQQALEILDAAWRGVNFQVQHQFRPESTLYLPEPGQALGGFRRSLNNFEVRIDYVQHSLSSLLALRKVLLSIEPAKKAAILVAARIAHEQAEEPEVGVPCTDENSSDPRDIYIAFWCYVEDGQIDKAVQHFMIPPGVPPMILESLLREIRWKTYDQGGVDIKIGSEDIDGDIAVVMAGITYGNGSTVDESVDMTKVDGVWKIDFSKMVTAARGLP